MDYFYNDFISNMCYSLTALLLKIQFGRYYIIEKNYRISTDLMSYNFNVTNVGLNNRILSDVLETEINDVLKATQTSKKLQINIRNSMLKIIKLNNEIVLSPELDNFISRVINKLMSLSPTEKKRTPATSRVNIDISRLQYFDYDSLYQVDNIKVDNIIGSSVVDNLNCYYRYTTQLLNQEKKDDLKIISIIAHTIGNYENTLSKKDTQKKVFLISQAISYYLDVSMNMDIVPLYTLTEIKNMLG